MSWPGCGFRFNFLPQKQIFARATPFSDGASGRKQPLTRSFLRALTSRIRLD